MIYTFEEPGAPERHDVQYFEMFGNRGIYHKGWTAVTRHGIPWELVGGAEKAFDDDRWELYDTRRDDTQAEDVSRENPEILHELQRKLLIEAARHDVLPLDDRRAERVIADLAGRPTIVRGATQVLFDGMRVPAGGLLDIKNRSHAITAEIEVPEDGAQGVILAQGTQFGGYTLYAPEGRLKYVYNFLGLETFTVEAPDRLSPGAHQVRMEFDYDGGGFGEGGAVTLFVDGQEVQRGRVERTHSTVFSTDAVGEVGDKHGSPLAADIGPGGNRWTGKIGWVRIDLGLGDGAKVLPPDDIVRVLLATQ